MGSHREKVVYSIKPDFFLFYKAEMYTSFLTFHQELKEDGGDNEIEILV